MKPSERPQPKIDCPTCGRRVGLNTSSYSGDPRIDTHSSGELRVDARSGADGAECVSSRTFVSQRVYDAALAAAEPKS